MGLCEGILGLQKAFGKWLVGYNNIWNKTGALQSTTVVWNNERSKYFWFMGDWLSCDFFGRKWEQIWGEWGWKLALASQLDARGISAETKLSQGTSELCHYTPVLDGPELNKKEISKTTPCAAENLPFAFLSLNPEEFWYFLHSHSKPETPGSPELLFVLHSVCNILPSICGSWKEMWNVAKTHLNG